MDEVKNVLPKSHVIPVRFPEGDLSHLLVDLLLTCCWGVWTEQMGHWVHGMERYVSPFPPFSFCFLTPMM